LIKRLVRRLVVDIAVARMLLRAGVRLHSVASYPFRRRLGDIRLVFRDGTTLVAPGGEPMLNLVREIFDESRYALPPLAAGDVIIDVGAHVGTFAVWASVCCPGTRIVCVEPTPVAADYLRRNIARNRLRNVTVVEAACASRADDRTLHDRCVMAMNTLFAPDARSDGTVVRCVTLDQLFELNAVRRCGFLKLDCEGAEYEILFSTSDEVLGRIAHITMEYHRGLAPYDERAVATFLRKHGFEVTVGPLEDEEGGYLYASRTSTVVEEPMTA
jgi:FkbM family methyltransferase